MKKFRFRLEKLLDIRIKKEDIAKEAFSKAMHALREKERLLADTSEELEYEKKMQKQKRLSGSFTSVEEDAFLGRFRSLQQMITSMQIEVNQAKNVVDKKREKLIETSKDRKVIERLKERKFEEYMEELNKEEQKFIDEIATMGASRENLMKMQEIEGVS